MPIAEQIIASNKEGNPNKKGTKQSDKKLFIYLSG
jgi:hypothetical protein